MNETDMTSEKLSDDSSRVISLDNLLVLLGAAKSNIDIELLKDLLEKLEMTDSELESLTNFDSGSYQRNLVAKTRDFELLILCFEAGQRTPIHDHAGSVCGVKVMRGTGVETGFEVSEGGWLYANGSHSLDSGGVVSSVDMDIHQLSNLQAKPERLVTVHVYSPPLGTVGNYSITDNSVMGVKADQRESRLK